MGLKLFRESPKKAFLDELRGQKKGEKWAGTSFSSSVLDVNPDGPQNHAVEGFLAARFDEGIHSVTIHKTGDTICFQMDHMQIASTPQVPIPGAVWLFRPSWGFSVTGAKNNKFLLRIFAIVLRGGLLL